MTSVSISIPIVTSVPSMKAAWTMRIALGFMLTVLLWGVCYFVLMGPGSLGGDFLFGLMLFLLLPRRQLEQPEQQRVAGAAGLVERIVPPVPRVELEPLRPPGAPPGRRTLGLRLLRLRGAAGLGWACRQQLARRQMARHEEEAGGNVLPLVRLTIEHEKGASINATQITQAFVGRVANPADLVACKVRPHRPAAGAGAAAEGLRNPVGGERSKLMADLIAGHLPEMAVLSADKMSGALHSFVEKEERKAIEEYVAHALKHPAPQAG